MAIIIYRWRRIPPPPPPSNGAGKVWFWIGVGLLALVVYGCVSSNSKPAYQAPPPVQPVQQVQPGQWWNKNN
jgi:hypothetical protein